MERELKMWWTLVSEARTIYRQDPFDPRLLDYIDELEVLQEMTDWSTLRAICGRALTVGAEKMARAAELRDRLTAAGLAEMDAAACLAQMGANAETGTAAIMTG
jgi:hypothetical protein